MAVIIEGLMKFTKTNNVIAPSVLVDHTEKKGTHDTVALSLNNEDVYIYDLGNEDFSRWKNVTREGSIEVSTENKHKGSAALKWSVNIDHKTDGEKGAYGSKEYLVGWPRIIFISKGKINLAKYDYLSFWVMIDSDRDEIADDTTPVSLQIITSSGIYDEKVINDIDQRKWVYILLPLNSIVKSGEEKCFLNQMQIHIGESNYRDSAKLTFYFDELSLISLREPLIKDVNFPSAILFPSKNISFDYDVLGGAFVKKGVYTTMAKLSDMNGHLLSTVSVDITEYRKIMMPVEKVNLSGKYLFELDILKGAKVISSFSKEIQAIEGPSLK